MSRCELEWADGWSPEHVCRKPKGHEGDHVCKCDAFISQWVAEHRDEIPELQETAEEARLRLRKELLALQQEESA